MVTVRRSKWDWYGQAVPGNRRQMDTLGRRLEHGPFGAWPRATGGDFGDALVEASQRLDPDIMVMGIRDFVERLPLSCVDAAAVPMLLIPDAPRSIPSDSDLAGVS
jgi:hypothetical protein